MSVPPNLQIAATHLPLQNKCLVTSWTIWGGQLVKNGKLRFLWDFHFLSCEAFSSRHSSSGINTGNDALESNWILLRPTNAMPLNFRLIQELPAHLWHITSAAKRRYAGPFRTWWDSPASGLTWLDLWAQLGTYFTVVYNHWLHSASTTFATHLGVMIAIPNMDGDIC